MRLVFAFLAEEASTNEDNGLYVKNGGTSVIGFAGVPAFLSGALVWAVDIDVAEFDTFHLIHITMSAPGNRDLFRFVNGFKVGPYKYAPDQAVRYYHATPFAGPDPETGKLRQVIIPAFGEYTFRFAANGQEFGSYIMRVLHPSDL